MISAFKSEINTEFKSEQDEYEEFKKYIQSILIEENVDETNCKKISKRLDTFKSLMFLNKVIYQNQTDSYWDSIYWKRI